MEINLSVSISQPPASVWAYLMDVTNDVHWRAGITKAVWTSPSPYGVGSTGEHTHKNMGILKWEVTGIDEGRSFEFVHRAGGLKGSTALFRVEPENNSSRVAVRMRVTGPFLMRIMMLFMGRMMRKGVRDDLEQLKENLERE